MEGGQNNEELNCLMLIVQCIWFVLVSVDSTKLKCAMVFIQLNNLHGDVFSCSINQLSFLNLIMERNASTVAFWRFFLTKNPNVQWAVPANQSYRPLRFRISDWLVAVSGTALYVRALGSDPLYLFWSPKTGTLTAAEERGGGQEGVVRCVLGVCVYLWRLTNLLWTAKILLSGVELNL